MSVKRVGLCEQDLVGVCRVGRPIMSVSESIAYISLHLCVCHVSLVVNCSARKAVH